MSVIESATVITATYDEPEGIAPRGTLIVLTGPGETAPAYARFGKRLSVDAYRVIVIEDDHAAAAREVLGRDDLVAPVVLVGTDQAARVAAEVAAAHPEVVSAVVTAGISVPGIDSGDAEASAAHEAPISDELAARTACPNHQRILTETSRSSLFAVRPAIELTAASTRLTIPVLAIHGSADQISPLDAALDEYRALGVLQVQVVDGGLHDVLNDVTHRSVAATIILFLERLRLARGLAPLVEAVRL